MNQTEQNNLKSIISIYYGTVNGAWLYLNPPYIEVRSFIKGLLPEEYKIMTDYDPDLVVVNRDTHKKLRRVFEVCPIIKVRTKDVNQFFSFPVVVEHRKKYTEYYDLIKTYFGAFLASEEKAVKQAIFALNLMGLHKFPDKELYISHSEIQSCSLSTSTGV